MSQLPNKPFFIVRGREIRLLDAAAAVLFLCFAFYYIFLCFQSVCSVDDSWYFTIPYRMSMGDRLIVDEWHFSMFSGIFQYLPMKAFIAFTGGIEGIVLYFRLLYTACKLVCFVYLYTNYRRYGTAALIGIAAFMAYDAFGCYILNYYTMSVMGMLIVTTELSSPKEKSMARLIIIGVVFASVVLIEPFAAFLYFVFTALVAVRWLTHKRSKDPLSDYGFVIDGKIWLGLTIGIILSATVFLFLFVIRNLKEVMLALPELFTDYEYDLSERYRFLNKLNSYLNCLGKPVALPLIAVDVILCTVLAARRKKERGSRTGRLLFAASAALFIGYAAVYLRSAISSVVTASFTSGFILFSLVTFGWKCYFLTREHNRRLFFVFLSGVLFSFFTDLSSQATLWVGLGVSALVVPVFIKDTMGEITREDTDARLSTDTEGTELPPPSHTRLRKKRLPRAVLAVSAAAGIAMFGLFLYDRIAQPLLECGFLEESFRDTVVIQKGLMKGISTIQKVKDCQEAAIADLDQIKSETTAPVFVANNCCWYYMYLNLPYSTFSAWYNPRSIQRQLSWWKLHPDKLPGYIYIPFFDCDSYSRDEERLKTALDFLSDCYDFEQEEGQAGYILRITGVHFPE